MTTITATAARTHAETVARLHTHSAARFLSPDATAANAALRAGHVALAEARAAWEAIAEAFPGNTAGPAEHVARRLAVAVEQGVARTFGIASATACGLYALTASGDVLEVTATDSGSDYLTTVGRWTGSDFWQVGEWPISDVVAFTDTPKAAIDLRATLR